MRLLTRVGCHLCDEAREIVAEVCTSEGIPWETLDVDSDAELAARYTDHVPVIFVDSEPHSYWFVDADRLKVALMKAPQL